MGRLSLPDPIPLPASGDLVENRLLRPAQEATGFQTDHDGLQDPLDI